MVLAKQPVAKKRAAKKVVVKVVTSTGERVATSYCRKCMQTLPAKDFYDAVDAGFIDANGLMSVCKSCIQGMYDKSYQVTGSFEKTILYLCKLLNVRFSQPAVDAARTHFETMQSKGKDPVIGFGIYKIKLSAVKRSMDKSSKEDMTFEYDSVVYVTKEADDEKETPDELKLFWGDYFKWDDIKFLQNEFNNFKKTVKTGTHPEVTLLREVCYKLLEVRNARMQERSTSAQVKELQELMKSLAISPNMISEAAGGDGHDRYSKWLEDIELYGPAEWLEHEAHEMFRDVVGPVEQYFQNYFVRPLQNLMLTSRDFNIVEGEEKDNFDELEAELEEGEDDGNEN